MILGVDVLVRGVQGLSEEPEDRRTIVERSVREWRPTSGRRCGRERVYVAGWRNL